MTYYLAKLIRKILLRLPLGVCYFLGRAVGLAFYLNGRKRRVAFGNIKSAFPHKSRRQVDAILKKSFISFGLNVIESLIAPRIYKYVTINGQDKVTPEGGIFVGIHAGNWEVIVSAFAQTHKFAVLAKPQKHKGLDRFLNELRRAGKVEVCFTLKELIKCLRNNYMIGMVLDHGAESDAMAVEFFSHRVSTPKGAVYLAKKFNKKIYTNFSYRDKGIFHIAEINGPIEAIGKEDKDLLADLNKVYEGYLKKYPWEYFWYYKRFKHKINRNVVILSDSKPGHLKQSKAFLSLLAEEKYEISSEVVEVRYKNRFSRFIADLTAFFAGKNCLGCGRCLSLLVDKDTWAKLDSIYADIVISAGSSTAAVNKLFASYLGAKSVTILKPNIPLKKFDLAVVPEHDRVEYPKIATFKGALSYPLEREEKIKACKEHFNLGPQKKIAVFIGGPLSDSKVFIENLKAFVLKLKEYSSANGYRVLASTSRRTPLEAENCLEKELGSFAQTEALVIAGRKNYDFVFDGFGYLADIIFVSSESISMVSEAASLGRPCVCVFLEEQDKKRAIFLDSIKEEVSFLKKPYAMDFKEFKVSKIFDKNREALRKAARKLL